MGQSTQEKTLEQRVGKLEGAVASIEPLRSRIEELEELVRRLRAELDELTGEPPGPKWHRTGSLSEFDDQTIAPG